MRTLKLLIVIGESASELSEVPTGARALIDAASEILVVAPALPSRLDWLASDTDRTREAADDRLREVVEQVSDGETDVSGQVGADDPLLAFEDAVHDFAPDHILIGLRSSERSGWQESGLVDQVLQKFGIPVTAFQVGR